MNEYLFIRADCISCFFCRSLCWKSGDTHLPTSEFSYQPCWCLYAFLMMLFTFWRLRCSFQTVQFGDTRLLLICKPPRQASHAASFVSSVAIIINTSYHMKSSDQNKLSVFFFWQIKTCQFAATHQIFQSYHSGNPDLCFICMHICTKERSKSLISTVFPLLIL